jgi:hypothetical protein
LKLPVITSSHNLFVCTEGGSQKCWVTILFAYIPLAVISHSTTLGTFSPHRFLTVIQLSVRLSRPVCVCRLCYNNGETQASRQTELKRRKYILVIYVSEGFILVSHFSFYGDFHYVIVLIRTFITRCLPSAFLDLRPRIRSSEVFRKISNRTLANENSNKGRNFGLSVCETGE